MKLKSFDEAVWFDYPDEPGVKFQIRPTPNSVSMEIQTKIRKPIPVPSETLGMKIVGDINFSQFTWDIIDYALVAWEGIEVEGVNDKIQIKKAILNYEPFSRFITAKIKELTDSVTGRIEDELKNSGSSQGG